MSSNGRHDASDSKSVQITILSMCGTWRGNFGCDFCVGKVNYKILNYFSMVNGRGRI